MTTMMAFRRAIASASSHRSLGSRNTLSSLSTQGLVSSPNLSQSFSSNHNRLPLTLPLPLTLTLTLTNKKDVVPVPVCSCFFSTKSGTSSLSSFAEPDPSLFQKSSEDSPSSVSQTNNNKDDPDVHLRNDVRNMGALLGKIIQHHEGQAIFEKVEQLRNYAKEWRAASAGRDKSKEDQATAAFDSMVSFASSLTDQELFLVSRAFTHFLAICNAAEAHHRFRRVNQDLARGGGGATVNDEKIRALRDSHDSCGRIFSDLLVAASGDGVDKQHIHKSICSQKVEFVLTAHPTEVNRRTLLDKKTRVLKLLAQADLYHAMGGATPYQRQLIDDAMEREVSGIWQSDEVSRRKPKPQTEAQRGTLVIDTVLWEAVPSFLRKLDATMKNDLGEEYGLPLDAAPIRFASWMGGDRYVNVEAIIVRRVLYALIKASLARIK